MLCVIISVVSWPSRTMRSVSSMTLAAVFGSSAAVCSSSSSSLGRLSVAISSVRAWRWPPESVETFVVRRDSRPRPRPPSSSRYCSFSSFVTPQERPRRWPRRAARARFSSIHIEGAVPIIGSWNTRPMNAARLCSGRFVTSEPSMMTLPESTKNVPAVALSIVDLPAPLPPMTVTKSPSFSVRLRPFSAVLALMVPGLKVL